MISPLVFFGRGSRQRRFAATEIGMICHIVNLHCSAASTCHGTCIRLLGINARVILAVSLQGVRTLPSRRDLIQMMPDEVSEYLHSQSRLIVVTNGPSGFPHPVPMNFAVDDEGRLLILTFRKSQKVKNLERDPRAALLVESGLEYHELKSVMIYAGAEIIDDRAEFDAARAFFGGKIQTRVESAKALEQAQAAMAKRVIVRFTPERTISWDHGKLGGRY